MTPSGTSNRSNKHQDDVHPAFRRRTPIGRWTPMVYPPSALLVPNPDLLSSSAEGTITATTNELFPLHWAVLAATLRELLLLDHTLDSQTLSVNTRNNQKEFRREIRRLNEKTSNTGCSSSSEVIVAPQYQGHLNGWKTTTLQEKEDSNNTNNKSTRNKGRKRSRIHNDHDTSQEPASSSGSPLNETNTVKAEDIVRAIIARCVFHAQGDDIEPSSITKDQQKDTATATTTATKEKERPPRKVSNSDSFSLSLVDSNLEVVACNEELTNFVTLERNRVVLKPEESASLPSFIQVGICMEPKLRQIAVRLCQRAFSTFETRTLGLFLGYRQGSSSRYRRQWIQNIANHIFQVSHAMFAWQQKEQQEVPPTTNEKERAMRVKQALFGDDIRAVRGIGGLYPYSLLPQALSIVHILNSSHHVTWSHFATTVPQGKAMFSHHANRDEILRIGKPRRQGRRWKNCRNNKQNDCRIASIHDNIKTKTMKRNVPKEKQTQQEHRIILKEKQQPKEVPEETSQPLAKRLKAKSLITSNTLEICLKRDDVGSSWGVSLLCRKNRDNTVDVACANNDKSVSGLQRGDIIVGAHNETGQTITSLVGNKEFFQSVVKLFQNSLEVHLQIQRWPTKNLNRTGDVLSHQ